MIFNSDAANEWARTHLGIVYGYEDQRQNLASAYDAGWTDGRSIGDPDAEKREILRDLEVARALEHDSDADKRADLAIQKIESHRLVGSDAYYVADDPHEFGAVFGGRCGTCGKYAQDHPDYDEARP